MKSIHVLLLFILAVLLVNCKGTKDLAAPKKIKSSLVYGEGLIHDSEAKLTWKFYENNPTSYLRYSVKDDINNYGWEMPTYEEVSQLLAQIGQDLTSNVELDPRLRTALINEMVIFSNSEEQSVGEKSKYQAIEWHPQTKTYSKKLVASGNKVYLFLIKR